MVQTDKQGGVMCLYDQCSDQRGYQVMATASTSFKLRPRKPRVVEPGKACGSKWSSNSCFTLNS